MCILSLDVFSQKYKTRTGLTTFKASKESFEPIEAENKSTSVLFNAATGDVASLIFVKAFHFKIALMEEHFNENYMDSDKFPKAIFKGKVQDFQISELSKQPKTYQVKGDLTIRGKKNPIAFPVEIRGDENMIKVIGKFEIKPEDFGIEIPSIVRDKIAPSTYISLNYELKAN